MSFKILNGEEIDVKYLNKVMGIDEIVYAADGYVGELENMVARYEAEPRSFICVEDEANGRLAGYINFIPCSDELYQDIRYDTEIIRDDDIEPKELSKWQQGDNNIFIISIATNPDYRDSGVIKLLTDAWIDYLNKMRDEGYVTKTITATAVSPDGKKALKRLRFVDERVLKEDGNVLFVCEGDGLRKLMANDLDFSK